MSFLKNLLSLTRSTSENLINDLPFFLSFFVIHSINYLKNREWTIPGETKSLHSGYSLTSWSFMPVLDILNVGFDVKAKSFCKLSIPEMEMLHALHYDHNFYLYPFWHYDILVLICNSNFIFSTVTSVWIQIVRYSCTFRVTWNLYRAYMNIKITYLTRRAGVYTNQLWKIQRLFLTKQTSNNT